MDILLRLPIVRSLHKRHLLFPTVILIVVAVVLVQGAFDRSPPSTLSVESTTAAAIATSVPRPVVRSDLEKTPLTYFSDYWYQLAEGARENLINIGPSKTPAILVGPRLALTTAQVALEVIAARERVALTSEASIGPLDLGGGGESISSPPADVARDADVTSPHRLRAWNEEIGLALFDLLTDNDTAFTLSDPRSLRSGSYLGAVTLDRDGAPIIIPGFLVTIVDGDGDTDTGDFTVSMALPTTLSVAAVMNLDGAMVGLAYAAPSGPRVVTTTEMLALIDAVQTDTICRSIEVVDLDDEVRRRLGLESGGVLVEYVLREAFTPEPSIRSGEVLLEWGGTALESGEHFRQLYDAQVAGSLVRYRVLRGRRRVTGGTVMPEPDCAIAGSAPVRLPRFGLAVNWITAGDDGGVRADAGWQVIAVAAGGPAAAAGVHERDQLLSIDDTVIDDERDRSTLELAGESQESLLLLLQRGHRAMLVAVPPRVEIDETDEAAGTAEATAEDDVDASR